MGVLVSTAICLHFCQSFEILRDTSYNNWRISERLQSIGLLNIGWGNLIIGATDAAVSWDPDAEHHGTSTAVMNDAHEEKMGLI